MDGYVYGILFDLAQLERSLAIKKEVIMWERCKELHQLVTEATKYMTSRMIRLNLQEALNLRLILSSAVHYYDDRLFSGKEAILLSTDDDPIIETVREIVKQLKRQALRKKLLEALCAKKEVEHEEGASNSLLLDTEIWDLVLLESGDVERNPGPLTRSQLEAVVDDILNEDISFQVFTSVCSLCANWHDLCLALGLPPSKLSAIRREQAGDTKACLREGLINWLQRDYNTEQHGLPTWRKLVEAVDHPAGGNNHALALKIAEEHKTKEDSTTLGASSTANQASYSDPKRGQAMCTAFANMYRAISRLLQRSRSLDVDELKDFLWCFCYPHSPQQRYVNPRVYEGATSTKDVLKRLCPDYINPVELSVLRGIVETFGSRQCKRLLEKYLDEFY